ncbi:hypothetical protein [Actinomadura formosensis]|uniref:hypothetical protein n=1 Tax=Actinomadura formosensis TaxID=60706 RepID=UPI003D8C8CFA
MNLTDRAAVRLLGMAGRVPPPADRVARADHLTSMADARAALALARGVPVRHVDPASGADQSPRAYRRARASWVAHLLGGGSIETVAGALDGWLERAPHIVAAVEAALEEVETS